MLGHFAQLILGGLIRRKVGQHLQLGAETAHFAGGERDRLERRIFLGQPDEIVAPEILRRHRRRQLMLPRLDRGDPFRRDGRHD